MREWGGRKEEVDSYTAPGRSVSLLAPDCYHDNYSSSSCFVLCEKFKKKRETHLIIRQGYANSCTLNSRSWPKPAHYDQNGVDQEDDDDQVDGDGDHHHPDIGHHLGVKLLPIAKPGHTSRPLPTVNV